MFHNTGFKHIINSGTSHSLHFNVHTMWSDYTITEVKLSDQNKQLFQCNQIFSAEWCICRVTRSKDQISLQSSVCINQSQQLMYSNV